MDADDADFPRTPPDPQTLARRRRRARVALVVLATAVLAWSAAWFYVPPLVSSAARDAAQRELGRELTLGAVRFNPWTLTLTIADATLAGPAPGAPPVLALKRARVDVAWSSLVRFAPIVDALVLDAPTLRLARDADGRLDVDDIVQRLAQRPRDPTPGDGPARFALHNIQVRGGSVDWLDAATGAEPRRVRDLELGVPFLSTLRSEREVRVEPRLAFTLDGTRFDSQAAAAPFTEKGAGEARLVVRDFDLAPWFGYLPSGLPLRPAAGTLGVDLQLRFEQRPALSLRISGHVELAGVRVLDPRAGRLADVGRIGLDVDDLRPLERKAALRRLEVESPDVLAVRDAQGRVNLMLAAETTGAAAPPRPVASVPMPAASPASDAAAASGPRGTATPGADAGWTVSLAELALRAGRLDWRDERVDPPVQLALDGFAFDAEAVGWPLAAPVVFRGLGRVGPGTVAPARAAAAASAAASAPTRVAPGSSAIEPIPPGAAAPHGGFAFEGRADARAGRTTVRLDAVPLQLVAPYVRERFVAPFAGALSAQVQADWTQPARATAPLAWRVDARTLVLTDVRVGGDARASELAIARVEVADARVDGTTREARVGRLALAQPHVVVARDESRRWNLASWFASAASASRASALPASGPRAAEARASADVPAARAPAAAGAASTPAWTAALDRLEVRDGRLDWRDATGRAAAAATLYALDLDLAGWGLDRAGASALKASARVSAREPAPPPVAAGASAPAATLAAPAARGRRGSPVIGTLQVDGELADWAGGAPTSARLAVRARDLPLQAADPYLDPLANLVLERAEGSFRGDVAWQGGARGPRLAVRGDASIDDVRASAEPATTAAAPSTAPGASAGTAATAATAASAASAAATTATPPAVGAALPTATSGRSARRLLDWRSLALRGLDLQLQPEAPLRLAVEETVLSDFYARVLLDENGQLNLQDVMRPASSPASGAAPTSAVAASAASAAPAAAPPAPAASGPSLRFGPVRIAGGRVSFTDRFVRPNYTAELSELQGALGGFASDAPAPGAAPALAELTLAGRVEGTATLEVTGRLNPLARPLMLDIQGKVRDLELPPLSPYAIKYAGYGIERGKLSVDVAYRVQPDGRLEASNKIRLNQLAFGQKVDDAPASLPVKLAVALLADRRGVIDLDLPVTGSIQDPQFSLGGIIWQAVRNLVLKAITSPFSLLASAFGGGTEQTSTVPFVPGTAELTPEAKASLDQVAVAIAERPGLTLTVSGESRAASEADAWKRERLRERVRAEKRRRLIAAGGQPGADVPVTPDEYPLLLREVWLRSDAPQAAAAASAASAAEAARAAAAVPPSIGRRLASAVRGLVQPAAPAASAPAAPAEPGAAAMEAELLARMTLPDDAMQQLAVRRGVTVRDYLAARNLPTQRLFLGAARTAPDAADWSPRASLRLQAL